LGECAEPACGTAKPSATGVGEVANPGHLGEGEGVRTDLHHEPISQERGVAAVSLALISPGAVESLAMNDPIRVPQDRHQPSTALPIRARPGLCFPWWAVIGRCASSEPGAPP